MSIEPDFAGFAREYEAGAAQLVSTRLVADLETPVSAFLKLSAGRKGNVFLLESVEGGAARGRYFDDRARSRRRLARERGTRAEINRRALERPASLRALPEKPLIALRALIAESAIAQNEGMPPMAAGVFGYLGYDMVREMERLAPAKTRSDRHARRHHDPADRDRRVQFRARRNLHRHPRAAGAGRVRRAPPTIARSSASNADDGVSSRASCTMKRPIRICSPQKAVSNTPSRAF